MNITLEIDSVDATLVVRYLNQAMWEAEKAYDNIKANPAFYIDFPVIVSNAKFDLEHSTRLASLIAQLRDEAQAKAYAI